MNQRVKSVSPPGTRKGQKKIAPQTPSNSTKSRLGGAAVLRRALRPSNPIKPAGRPQCFVVIGLLSKKDNGLAFPAVQATTNQGKGLSTKSDDDHEPNQNKTNGLITTTYTAEL